MIQWHFLLVVSTAGAQLHFRRLLSIAVFLLTEVWKYGLFIVAQESFFLNTHRQPPTSVRCRKFLRWPMTEGENALNVLVRQHPVFSGDP